MRADLKQYNGKFLILVFAQKILTTLQLRLVEKNKEVIFDMKVEVAELSVMNMLTASLQDNRLLKVLVNP